MVPEKYRLAAVGRFLLEQFELRRPGFREWSPQVEAALRQDAEGELQLMEKQLRELGVDDARYWQRVRRALDEILLPRYAALATGEIELAKRDYGIWRGGDVAAPAALAEEARGAGRGPAPRQRDPRHLPAAVRADPRARHAFRSLRAFRGAARGAR